MIADQPLPAHAALRPRRRGRDPAAGGAHLPADKADDGDRFRNTIAARDRVAGIPPKRCRSIAIDDDKTDSPSIAMHCLCGTMIWLR